MCGIKGTGQKLEGGGAGAERGWVSKFYVTIKDILKVSSDKQPKLFVLKTKFLLIIFAITILN